MGLAFTNISPSATWRSTYWSVPPYTEEPTLFQLPGFSFEMVRPDILHVCHLGTCRDLIASGLRELTRSSILFQAGTQALRLREATARLHAYCGEHGYNLSLRKLSSKSLGFGVGYPELKAKGYDSFIILRWLVMEITTNRPQNYDMLCTCLWSLDSFLSVATNANRFFTQNEAEHIQSVGLLFLKTYLQLAVESLARKRRLYKVRPKFHLLCHLIFDMPLSRANWTFDSTWMDEDFNKVCMTVTKKVHRRSATKRTLQRWLLAVPGYLEHADRPC